MLHLVLLLSLVFTQSIALKSKQNTLFNSRAIREIANDVPDDSKCSGGTTCVSILQCPKLFEQYMKIRKLSKEELKSLERGYCGWSRGAAHVCCDTVSESELHCGDSVSKVSRSYIIGGNPSKLGDWPWMAALYKYNDNTKKTSFRCGGSLISREWVLTAAHCVPEDTYERLAQVRLGDLNIDHSVNDSATPIDVDIKEVIMHSKYTRKPVTNDIALLRLSKPVEYTANIRPICLHAGKTYQKNITLYDRKKPFIAGWGDVEFHGGRSNHLLDVEIYVEPLPKCSKSYDDFIKREQIIIDETIICASAPGKDSCQGDSGGPLMFIDNGFWHQIGIVSVGYECANANYPGIYTKVVSFIDWINEKTGLNL